MMFGHRKFEDPATGVWLGQQVDATTQSAEEGGVGSVEFGHTDESAVERDVLTPPILSLCEEEKVEWGIVEEVEKSGPFGGIQTSGVDVGNPQGHGDGSDLKTGQNCLKMSDF